MFWNLAAFFAGAFTGSAFNWAIVTLNFALFPPPEGMDPMDMDALAAYVAGLPTTAFLIVLVAHLGQAFVGAGVAAVLAVHKRTLAMLIGVLTLLGGVYNLMSLPHPTWMWIEVPLYLVVAWAGGELAIRYGPSFDDASEGSSPT